LFGLLGLLTGAAALRETRRELAGMSSAGKKMLVVSHDAGFYGAQLLAIHLVRHLTDRLGMDVRTALLGDGPLQPEFESLGPVVDFTNPPWRTPPTKATTDHRRLALRALYREGFRHALCNTSASGFVAEMLAQEGFEVVVLVHELPNVLQQFKLDAAVQAIGRSANRVVFPADAVRNPFLPLSGVDPARCVIRPQGLYKTNPYRDERAAAHDWLANELGVARDSAFIVAAGPGDKRKGVDIFCQVACHVAPSLPKAHFVWIGDDQTDVARDCEAWIDAAGLRSRVTFRGVVKDPDLYCRHIAAADLYLMSSREDPFPTVVLDAMSVGVPVVGFAGAGGFAELLEQGAGVLVPLEDRSAMAQAVVELLRNLPVAKRLGRQGREIIAKRFDFGDYVHDLLCLLGIHRPRVSVVVPNFNYARYLPGRLKSIFGQTYRPWEIIFLDDHSSDDSLVVARALLESSSIHWRIVDNEVNQGCYPQWLTGIGLATGDLVWIAEADDLCDERFLETLIPAFADPAVALAYCQSRKVDADGKTLRPDYLDYTASISRTRWLTPYTRVGVDEIGDTLAIKNTIPNASAVLMRKPDLQALRDRLAPMRNAGDWLAYVHLLEAGSIHFNPEVLNDHRVHAGGVTRGGNALRHFSEILQVQQYIRSRHALDPGTLAQIEVMRQSTYEYLGLQAAAPNYLDHPGLQDVLNPEPLDHATAHRAAAPIARS